MRRREFIAGLGGVAATTFPILACAEVKKTNRIGVLWHASSADEEKIYLDILMEAFGNLGYVEGKNAEFLHRFPAEQPDRFRALARELVEDKVDAIVAVTGLGAKEAKQASSIVPVVVVFVSDAVGDGLVESLAHPGGNVTGLSLMTGDLTGKRLTLLKEAVPNLSRVALFFDPRDPFSQRVIAAHLNAVKVLGLSLRPVETPSPDALEQAFSIIPQDGTEGVALGPNPMMFTERVRIGAACLARKIPTVGIISEMVPHGLLMSYGQDFPEYFRKAASYVDKILKGAKPADLPVEQPTRLKLVINLKTAKTLGLTIPSSLLVTADEVIE